MAQVEVMLHPQVHKTKPIDTDYGKLRGINELKLQKVTLKELAEHVSKGRIFFPSVHAGNGNVKSNTFIRQQLCLVDIDNVDPKKTDAPPYPFTEENIIALAKEFGLEVAIIYRTQSYTPELPKFRVGFVADRVFTEYEGLLKEAHYALFKIFNSVYTERLVDTSCNEASRLFNGALYGSKPYVNENAAPFNAEALIELTKDLPKVPGAPKPDEEKNKYTITKGESNNTTDSIEAIKAGNVHKFRSIFLENLQNDGADNESHLSHFAYKALTDNAEDVIIELDLIDVHELFNQLPMTDLFSLPNTKFACVVHDDSRPSASISTYPEGNHMYKCFADGCMCHKAHSNFMLLEHFVGSKRKAFRFIHSLFDIEMKTELSKRVKQNMAFIESDTFKKVCPVTYYLISRSHFKRKLFETLKCVASVVMPVQLTKDENDCSFFYSMSEIEKLMKSTIAGTSPDSICQTMSFAALLGLINKRADEDLTDDVYNKLQDQRLRTAERTEQEASDVRRLSVYSVPLISEMDLNQLEAIAIKAKNSGISVSKMNRNLVAQIFGEDVAKSVYPTEDATVISYKKKLKNANVVEKAVQQCLQERGVVDRKTIKEMLKEFSMSNNEFNEAYTVALAKLGLQTVTAKNEHRELFGIDFPRNTRISFYPEGVEISNSTEEVIGVTNQKEESIPPFMSMLIDEINRPVAEQEMKQLTYAEATKAVREELDDVAVMQERVRFEMAVEKLIFDEEINDLLNDIEEETHTEESIVEIPVEVEEVQIVDNVGFNCTLKTEYDRNSTARRNPIPLIRVLSMYYDFQVLPLSQKTLLRRSQHVFKVDNASKDYEYMDLKKSRKRAPAGRRMPYSRCKPNNNWKVCTLDKSIIACT